MKKFLFYVLFLFTLSSIFSLDNNSVSSFEAFQVSVVPQSHEYVWVKFNIAPEYHLYQNKIAIINAEDSSVKLGTVVLPDPSIMTNDLNESINVYHNNLDIQIPILTYGNGDLHIIVKYQGCKGASLCLPEAQLDQKINLTRGNIISNNIVNTTVNSNNSVNSYFTGSPIMVVIGFFLLGLLIAFTPCVFPLLPILFTIVSNNSVNLFRGFILAFSYILGGATVYALAGIIAVMLGTSLTIYLQTTWMNVAIAIIFIIFALSMYDLFEIKLPNAIQTKLGNKVNSMRGMSIFSTFIIGGISNLILSPCVTAPLASALLYISSTHNYILGASSLFALGFGSGVPLLIISLFGKKYLPKSGNWMIFTKRMLAIIMVAMAGYTLSKVLFDYDDVILAIVLIIFTATLVKSSPLIISKKWIIHALMIVSILGSGVIYKQYAATKMLSADDGFNKITQVDQLEKYLQIARQQNKPIIIDFYANWCSACREMDLRTFSNKDVQKSLEKFELVRIDSTNNTSEIQQMQTKFGIFALPAVILLYPNGAIAEGFQSYGFVKSKDLIDKLDKFNDDFTQICLLNHSDIRC